jgi:hypothetical protein
MLIHLVAVLVKQLQWVKFRLGRGHEVDYDTPFAWLGVCFGAI